MELKMHLRLLLVPLVLAGACAPSHGYVSATYAHDGYVPPPPPVYEQRVYVTPYYDRPTVYRAPHAHPHHHYHPAPRVERAPPAYVHPHYHADRPYRAPPAPGYRRR
jgi:hypothetical protein